MLIKDILNKKLITCDVNKELYEACKLMKDNNIGFLPITENYIIIGVITDRDIVIRYLANEELNIKNILSTDIKYIDSNQSILDALYYMKEYKIKRLLVKEDKGYVGVLSISDILKYCDDKKEILDTIKSIYSYDTTDNNVEIDTFEL